jgi:hypothetical protein
MNFFKLNIWAKLPKIDHNNNIVISSSQEFQIPPCEFFKINLGLTLVGLPTTSIVKIFNPHKKFILISKQWLPGHTEELSLTVVSKLPLNIKSGEDLVHIQLITIDNFLPGYYPTLQGCLLKN